MKNSFVAIAIIIAILISGSIGYVVGTNGTFEKTQTVTSIALAQCSDAQSPNPIGLLFGAVHVGTSPATICLQLYYYDSSALTLNLSRLLSIDMGTGGGGKNSGGADFTVVSSQGTLVIGGASSENEGTVVGFALIARTGSSGTYGIGVVPLNTRQELLR